MGKVTIEYESKYEVGDVCVFKKDDRLTANIVANEVCLSCYSGNKIYIEK